MRKKDEPLTLSVPEAGERYFGLSRDGSYDAARRGDLPTIRMGRLLRVPVRTLEAMLDRVSAPEASASKPAQGRAAKAERRVIA